MQNIYFSAINTLLAFCFKHLDFETSVFYFVELKENADGIIFIEKDGKKLSKFLIEC